MNPYKRYTYYGIGNTRREGKDELTLNHTHTTESLLLPVLKTFLSRTPTPLEEIQSLGMKDNFKN